MKVTRRQFLTYCAASAAAVGLDIGVLGRLSEVLSGSGPTVIWLSGASCTGCTVSLANRVSTADPGTDVGDLLINHINLAYHATLMGAAGDVAVSQLKTASAGKYILAVEGGIPTAFGGNTCILYSDQGKPVTALSAVKSLAAKSIANLSIGTCASFGGIPAGKPNPTKIQSLKTATGRPVINIPGCPTHPDWVVWTIAQLLAGKTPALDSYSRPKTLYSKEIHENCPRKEMREASSFAVEGCLEELGCKGPKAKADCPTRKWNNGTNWCIGANSICVACTESGFPDAFSPFYRGED
jgi:hydrogenase small subunit